MTLLELVHRLRQRLDDTGGDTGSPPTGYSSYSEYDDSGNLWKNDELTRLINDARIEFTRRNPIVDSENFTLMLRPGVPTYELELPVLAVQRVYSAQQQRPLTKTFFEEADQQSSSPPARYYIENLQTHRLTILGTPVEADTLTLTVERLVLDPLTWARRKTDDEEIDAQWAGALVEYVAHLCYLKRDADTFSVDLSALALQAFDRMVGPSRSAVDLAWSRGLSDRKPRARAQFL